MQNDGYAGTSKALLEQARGELASGDLLQASEKLWGAAAHMVKAIAERRGWPHNTHRRLWQAINQLADDSDDTDLRTFFAVAESLHANFYENWQAQAFVEQGADTVDQLIGKLDQL